MRETPEEVAALQELMDASHGRSTSHLREIVSGARCLTAEQVLEQLTGMKVLSLATVTAAGEPRVSAAHVDGERLGVFCHGRAVRLTPQNPRWTETIEHWTAHYGSDPTTWGEDIRMFRIEPTWLVGYGTVGAD